MNELNLKNKIKEFFYIDSLHERKIVPFLIFVSFIASFLVGRGFALFLPQKIIIINGYHIHHFFFGIFFISIAGITALISHTLKKIKLASVMFGIGLGLLTDEIGLLLTCTSENFVCNYWSRLTYDFIVVIILVYLITIFFDPMWLKRRKALKG